MAFPFKTTGILGFRYCAKHKYSNQLRRLAVGRTATTTYCLARKAYCHQIFCDACGTFKPQGITSAHRAPSDVTSQHLE